jgi:tetratricopeptide (TPR) repeat protein
MIAVVALVLLAAQSEAHLRAGQEKLKVRDFDGAIPEFEKCLALHPEQYNAHFGLGTCHWEKDEYRKARDHFAKVVELVEKANPGAPLPAVHQKLLGCALLLEEFDAAVGEATKLIAIQATGEYYFARALARQRKGDLKGALDDGASAIAEDPRLTKARSLRASVLAAQGDAKGAMDEMAAAIQAKPSDPAAYLARACIHYRAERWAEAAADLESARKLFTGLNSDLESQAVAIALARLAGLRRGVAPPAVDFARQLKDFQKSPAKNHLLTLPLYFTGDATEAALLQSAEEAPARKSQARAEVWFFIGERKLLAGDKDGAREAFTKAVDAGAAGVFEADLARVRLAALQNR